MDGPREGYPAKDWWWGCYNQHTDVVALDLHGGGGFCEEMRTGSHRDTENYWNRWDANAGAPGNASATYASNGRTYLQHDYFVHSKATDVQDGHYLTWNWHKPERGGFDGRYIQLFPDRRPLRVYLSSPANFCTVDWVPTNLPGYPGSGVVIDNLTVSGGATPYQVTWTIDGVSTQTPYPLANRMVLPFYSTASITVRSSAADPLAQSVTYQLNTQPLCDPVSWQWPYF
jgi:hypothetical protein